MENRLEIRETDAAEINTSFYDNISSFPCIRLTDLTVSIYSPIFFMILLIARGGGEYVSDDSGVSLVPGSMVFCPPAICHSFQFDRSASVYLCAFMPDKVEDAPDDFRILRLKQPRSAQIHSIFEQMAREDSGRELDYENMEIFMLRESLTLLRRSADQDFKQSLTRLSWKQRMVNSVLSQIDSDPVNIDFEKIARQNGIAMSYFRKVFKETVGLPPQDYLNRVRIDHALELLRNSDSSVADIAAAVGFYDANYFSRLFRKITGCTPSKTRAAF